MRGIRSLLTGRASRGLSFAGPAARRIAARVAALPAQHGLPRLLELVALLDALARLPARAAQPLASEGFTPALNLAQAQRLETICRFVHAHFRDKIRLGEMAALAHLTPEAFSRFFRQKTGKTFVEFLNDVRIGEACRLLIEQDTLGVTEICYGCGYENVSNFNRHFRLRHRLGPRDFRRRYLSTVCHVHSRRGPRHGEGSRNRRSRRPIAPARHGSDGAKPAAPAPPGFPPAVDAEDPRNARRCCRSPRPRD